MAAKATAVAQRVTQVLPELVRGAQDIFFLSKPVMRRAWGLAKVELAPPSPGEIGQIQKEFAALTKNVKGLKFLDMPAGEVAKNALVGVEIFCWFIAGEVIGRGSIIGYAV